MSSLSERPEFASTPKDAMQCYCDAVLTNKAMEASIGLTPFYRTRADWIDECNLLASVPVYFWNRDTARVVKQASASYPLGVDRDLPDIISACYLPRILSAFCVFDSEIIGDVIEGHARSFSALAWRAVHPAGKPHELKLVVQGYTWMLGRCTPVWWGSDISLTDDEAVKNELLGFWRWILTASMFLEQEIVVQDRVSVGSAVGKRARNIREDSDCHVVSMRRAHRENCQYHGEPSAVDWNYQWLVRGHWRNQWYPKAQRNVPIYINPYLKGPDGKPMKTPAPTVFAVTR